MKDIKINFDTYVLPFYMVFWLGEIMHSASPPLNIAVLETHIFRTEENAVALFKPSVNLEK